MNLKKLVLAAIIGTGMSSVTAQLLTLREFLSTFHGNEVVISITIFCWLILAGAGSFMARFIKNPGVLCFSLLLLLTGLLPLGQIIAIRLFQEMVFTHGVSTGFNEILIFTVVIVAPYCLLMGFILPYSQKVLQKKGYRFSSGKLYQVDSIGDILGGVLFSFILVYFLKPFPIIAVTSSICLLITSLLLWSEKRYFFMIAAVIITVFFYFFSLNERFELSTLRDQYGRIVFYQESSYGRIVVTEDHNQYTFFESGRPLFSNANIIAREETVHYPLSQLENINDVLLISGGAGGTIDEILKYQPKNIDYLELDPVLIKAAGKFGFLTDHPGLRIINQDGREYINRTHKRYSAIILDIPDPDTFQLNRFFTTEFYQHTSGILEEGGILSFSLDLAPNYLPDFQKNKLSSIYNTVTKYYRHVLIVPGERAYFLCRNREISYGIPEMLRKKSIKTAYISGYFAGNVTKERIALVNQAMDLTADVNTDLSPAVMRMLFRQWFEKYGSSPVYFILIILTIFFIYLVFIKKEEFILFTTGFATMGIEIIIILYFQIIHGYAYLKIGAIITSFLLGLLPGAAVGEKIRYRETKWLIFSEILLISMLGIFLLGANLSKNYAPQSIFLIYGFLFAFFCGFQFPIITNLIGENKSPAAGCFAADLAGASFGTIITGLLLIPFGGVNFSIAFLVLLKILSAGLAVTSISRIRR